MMMPCSRPLAPGAFVRPGSNAAAAAADPALAATWHQINIWERGRPREYIGNSGLDVAVRVWLNRNGEIENDIEMEVRRAARAVVRRAVVAACSRQL